MELIRQVKNYQPFNEQEVADRDLILAQLTKGKAVLYRSQNEAHLTASAWVLNQERSKVLMVYHNIYDSWSWMGGHADGEEDLLAVALREVKEESGLKFVRCIQEDIFSLEVLTVDGHWKHGAYISSHLHLNLTYLLEASEEEPLVIKPDENSGVAWFSLEGAVEASSEPWLRNHIYTKLNGKLTLIKGLSGNSPIERPVLS